MANRGDDTRTIQHTIRRSGTIEMTIVRSALWGLRIFGPCSVSDLAERTGLDRQAIYRAVYRLRSIGLVERLGPASYDVTDAGRRFLETPLPPPAPVPRERQLSLFDP